MNWLALTLPGVLVAYFLYLRPFLHAKPALQAFYDQADGFWAKVWAICGKSVVLAFAYFIQAVSWALQLIDPLAAALGDPELRQQITTTLSTNPQILGWVAMAISGITIVAKLRSLTKSFS